MLPGVKGIVIILIPFKEAIEKSVSSKQFGHFKNAGLDLKGSEITKGKTLIHYFNSVKDAVSNKGFSANQTLSKESTSSHGTWTHHSSSLLVAT